MSDSYYIAGLGFNRSAYRVDCIIFCYLSSNYVIFFSIVHKFRVNYGVEIGYFMTLALPALFEMGGRTLEWVVRSRRVREQPEGLMFIDCTVHMLRIILPVRGHVQHPRFLQCAGNLVQKTLVNDAPFMVSFFGPWIREI